jgi:hypothetical protein
LADALARRGREHVAAHFDTSIVAGRFEALYHDVAARGASRA